MLLSFHFPLDTKHDGLERCERCGQWCYADKWTNGDAVHTLGRDCARAMGFEAEWNQALREDTLDTLCRLAGEPGFVGSFAASCRDRLMNGGRLTERQSEVFNKLCREREIPHLRSRLLALYAAESEAA